jgi:hypothetical protein
MFKSRMHFSCMGYRQSLRLCVYNYKQNKPNNNGDFNCYVYRIINTSFAWIVQLNMITLFNANNLSVNKRNFCVSVYILHLNIHRISLIVIITNLLYAEVHVQL